MEELELLQETGVIGDALGRYFNRDGQPVKTFMDNRVIGIDLDDLKKIPWSVLVAGGENKIDVLMAAMKTGCFNVLVTTQSTGSALIAEADETKRKSLNKV
jgi:DNA-binding transcriptional regulator LsrR (DeoR family)